MGQALPAQPVIARLEILSCVPDLMEEEREVIAHWLRYEAVLLMRDGDDYPDDGPYKASLEHGLFIVCKTKIVPDPSSP